jgi:indole-3-glycerol phosphate synthase
MMDMLKELVRNAHDLVRAGYYDTTRVMRAEEEARSLRAALSSRAAFPLIAEVKLASPSRKRIAAHRPSELIRSYEKGGAAGISVLTEPKWFAGALSTLGEAADSGLPVLMKDFVVDERQITAAGAQGASAVLLIEEVFDGPFGREERRSLIDFAHCLGLEVLLEANSERSLERAMESKADLIGLNQRDLSSMDIDLERGKRLLRCVRGDERPAIVMSGIGSRRQVESLRDAGAAAVLIGGAASSSSDPVSFLRSLEMGR